MKERRTRRLVTVVGAVVITASIGLATITLGPLPPARSPR